jgi:hypothetical protein
MGFMMSAKHAKMAALLEAFMKDKQCLVFCFLVSKGTMPTEIHHYIKLHYSNESSSLWQVDEWSRKFKNGMSCVTDATRPGQAHRVVSLRATAEDEHVIRENCGIKVDEVATMLDNSQY